MQKDRLYYELEALEYVIANYNACTTTLTQSETHLMKKHLLDMERHILPGLTRISWTALGIKDYIKDITKGTEFILMLRIEAKYFTLNSTGNVFTYS